MPMHEHSRRSLLKAATALPFLGSPGALQAAAEQLVKGLRIIRGPVNTAVFERNGKLLLIDSGDLDSAPGGVAEWALFTHYHRDQASAAFRLAAKGTKVAAPAREARLFTDIYAFWDSADNLLYHRYNFRPCLFAMREPVPVARALAGGETFEWEGLRFEVIDTPGHTDGSVTYLVEIGGKRVAFTGDLICGPGKIWEVYSLQKALPGMANGYTGFGGAVPDVEASLDRVLERKPDLLVPSHGVIIGNPANAVAELKKNLDALMDNFLSTAGWRIAHPGVFPKEKSPMLPSLPAVAYPPWLRDIAFTSRAIVAEDTSVFLTDCGSQAVIEKLARLRASREIGSIDGMWITHYHDDHTEYVNAARRRFGMRVYVQRRLLDIIENPVAYNMPCLYPESVHADRVLEHGESFAWKGFKLTAYYFPGQTLYHAGLAVEKDGYKVLLTGDSFNNWGVNSSTSENRCFLGRDAGYEDCLNLMLEIKPDLLVSSHYGPVPVSLDYFRKTLTTFKERAAFCRKLFPHDDINFGLDPYWAHAYPYRQAALPGSQVVIEARVMNHAVSAGRARATLHLPEGWKGDRLTADTSIPPRTEGRIRLSATAPAAWERRRHVLGISIELNGKRHTEFAEAIIDFLGG